MKGDNYYKEGARSLSLGRIHTSKTGRTAYTPGFIGRDKPTDFRKILKTVVMTVWIIICGLAFVGICYDLKNPHKNVVKYENWRR